MERPYFNFTALRESAHVMHLSTGLFAAGSAILVGVIFGTYPARLAAQLAPVDAIARE